MSADCHTSSDFSGASTSFKRVLLIVIAINASMFMVEMIFGIVGQSQALKADALDFLGDSATYALSLWAIGKADATRSNVAIIKGISLLLIALWVLGTTLYYALVINHPSAPIMSTVALAALAANVVSVVLLMKYRDGDANVRSVWLCSRNDAIGNIAVIGAAGAVALTGSHWPDLLVAFALAALFSNSALKIIQQAQREKSVAANS